MKIGERRWIGDKHVLVFIFVVLCFLAIKVPYMNFKFSDENIYFYMGKLILDGSMPYRDFLSTNMPLQLSIIALFLSIIGQKIILLKLIPIIASVISSVFIFLLVKRRFDSLYALISSSLYLFSFVVLTTTDHSTGVHITTMFTVIGCYLVYREKYLLSGVMLSLALMTRLYAAFPIIGLAIYLFFRHRKGLLKFLAGVLLVFLPANIILALLFKMDYVSSVFLYGLLRSEGIPKLRILKFFLRWDILLIILSLLAIFFKDKKSLLLPLIVAGTVSAFYLFYQDIYYLYFTMLAPFLAILAGYALCKLINKLPKKLIITILVIGIIAAHNSFFYIKDHALTARIDFIGDVVGYVRENSRADERIYGSFEIIPLIALLSARRITNNYVDTNEKTFLTGLYDIGERTESLKGNVKFVVMKLLVDPTGKVIEMERIIDPDFLMEECSVVQTYWIRADYSSNAVVLFDCS